mgnify:FL=1|tara:strand:- start:52 stop:495 length:444 start_codon:yes stop_codon:yes gene_type:complete
MNKKELKALIKPLVKECIREALFEEGMLSTVISEVVKGTSGLIVEQRQEKIKKTTEKVLETNLDTMHRLQERKQKSNNQKRKLLDAIGSDAYGGVDLFEGTEPLRKGGDANTGAQPQGALSNYAPEDAGVNIDGLINIAGGSWKKFK